MSKEEYDANIKEGVVDKIQEIFEKSKVQLQKVQCPEHGQALKELEFDRGNGRFKFDTCCVEGNKLVEAMIANL
jgi:ssDNA-binding Zn-finger/Zn-ribbon topoisomerase 1